MAKISKQKVSDVLMELIAEPKGIVRMDVDQEYIKQLAQSISEIGLLQPVLIAIDGDGYEMVAGQMRYLAHKKLGLSKIKAVIRKMSPEEIGLARATENIARHDLTPLEEAATYRNLIDEYGLTLEKVSQKMGKTPGTIRRRMDLLRMPPMLQQAVHRRQISITVAEELWTISDEAQLDYYLSFAIEDGCTKAVARQWAKDWKDQIRRAGTAGGEGSPVPLSPFESRPTYIACDICEKAVKLEEIKYIRTCPVCTGAIKEGLGVSK
ncbi:Nucleoid occlusion protein [subsurface metagenome]